MFTQSFLKQVAERVEKLESQSSVELVVVLSDESGHYREIEGHCGFAAVLTLLVFALYSPWEYPPELLMAGVVIAYLIGYALGLKISGLRRLFSSAARRRRQVESQARDAFMQKKVSHTRERTGLLLYLSEFERMARLIPDTGIEAKVPLAVFNTQQAKWDDTASTLAALEEAVLKGLDELAAILAEHLPRPEDDQDELPNEIWFMKGGVR